MIDSHCHLNFDSLKENLKQIINKAKANNITSILSINTKIEEFQSHYELIKNYNSIYLSIGQHPDNINNNNIISKNEIIEFSKNKKVVGIGETGLDFYHSKEFSKSQYKSFENHIEASIETKLPLIIHQRNSEKEIINFLSNYDNYSLPLVMHCFTGTERLKDFCIKHGYYISLSGIITFKNAVDIRNVIKNFPLNLILLETDSPFLTPEPYRGVKPNDPSYVYYIGKYLSNFYNISLNEFEKITNNNFYSLFKKAIRYKEILYEG